MSDWGNRKLIWPKFFVKLGWWNMSQWTNKNKLKKNKQLMWLGVIRMEKLIALRITIPSANDFIYEP